MEMDIVYDPPLTAGLSRDNKDDNDDNNDGEPRADPRNRNQAQTRSPGQRGPAGHSRSPLRNQSQSPQPGPSRQLQSYQSPRSAHRPAQAQQHEHLSRSLQTRQPATHRPSQIHSTGQRGVSLSPPAQHYALPAQHRPQQVLLPLQPTRYQTQRTQQPPSQKPQPTTLQSRPATPKHRPPSQPIPIVPSIHIACATPSTPSSLQAIPGTSFQSSAFQSDDETLAQLERNIVTMESSLKLKQETVIDIEEAADDSRTRNIKSVGKRLLR